MQEEHQQTIAEIQGEHQFFITVTKRFRKFNTTKWLFKRNNIVTRLNCRDDRNRYKTLIPIAIYLVQTIQIQDLNTNCHISCANHPFKDNMVKIIEKNTTPKRDEFCNYPYHSTNIGGLTEGCVGCNRTALEKKTLPILREYKNQSK